MKYCSNCGKEIPNETSFCPSCGTKVGENKPNPSMNQNSGNNGGMVEEKNIVTCIILSIVTCGIYGIIWYINLVDDVNRICNDDKSSQSGATVFLLTLITCGIYGIIWFHNCGQRLAVAGRKYGKDIQDNSTLYLILSIVGLQIVAYCLIQIDLNKIAE